MPYRLLIKFSSGLEVLCLLRDEAELEKLISKSSFKSTARLWGDEVYFKLPVKLKLKGERKVMEIGEVAYWPEGSALCLFFGPTPVSTDDKPVAYSEVKPLGKIVQGLEYLKNVRDGEELECKITRE
ncbi:MAG: cyclophilin-like fold protein [Nitrososphaerota archaeon]